MENWLGFCRNSSQNPRIEGRTINRDVMETIQLLTSLISKCAVGSFCFLHRTVVFWNISTHSSCVAAMVPSLLGLSVQGSRKTTYFFFVFSSPTFCSGRHNLIGLVHGQSQVCSLCQGWEKSLTRYKSLHRRFFFFFLFVLNFVIHWNETAMGLHVFPIPIPPPTSLSTLSP